MVILINPFRVAEGREAEFLALWDQTNAIFRRQPGYLHARLVRALGEQAPGQTAPFTHCNVAEWESRAAYASALADPELRKLAARYRELSTFNPALYDIIRDDRG